MFFSPVLTANGQPHWSKLPASFISWKPLSRLNHHITWITSKASKSSWLVKTVTVAILARHMLWFNFILGLNFIFLCFKFIIIHYHTQKQRKTKFKPRIKLNYNIYKWINPWLTKLAWLTYFVTGLVLSFCWTCPFFRAKKSSHFNLTFGQFHTCSMNVRSLVLAHKRRDG